MPPTTRVTRATKATKATRATRATRSGGVEKPKEKPMPRKEESEPEVVVPPEDMTVVQLRAALKKRGLATNGLKAELVERLTSAPDQAEMAEETEMKEAQQEEPAEHEEPKGEAAALPSASVGAAEAAPGPSPTAATATPHATPVEEEAGAGPAADAAAGAAAAGPVVTTPASQVFSPRLPGYEVPPFPAPKPEDAAAVVPEAVEEAAAGAPAPVVPSVVPPGVATEITDVPPGPAAAALPISAALLGLPTAGGRAAADEEEEAVDVHRVVQDPGSPRAGGGPTGHAAQEPAGGTDAQNNAQPAKGDLEAPAGEADETPEKAGE